MTLEEIVNNIKSAGQDYGQLFNNNPRMDNFASVLQQGLGQLIPSNADFKSPEAMRDWGTAAALNAPMGLSIKNPNLNAGLLDKHLSGQKLTPEEMALYEKNGSAMETPLLQRYNLGNANAQGGSPQSRELNNGYNTDVYHGMSARRDFWGNSPDLIALDSNTGKAEGGRLFSSDDPRIASQYSGHRTETPVIYPLSIKDDSIFSAPIKNWDIDKGGTTLNGINTADEIGKNTALFKGVVDTPGYNPNNEFLSNVYASKKDIRSRFAAFDPLRKNSSNILASGLLGSLLLKQMNQESSQQ